MDIKELKYTSGKRAKYFKNKASTALEYYIEKWDTNSPVYNELLKVFNDLMRDDFIHVMDHLHSILSDGYYANEILLDYKDIKNIYVSVVKYVTYRTLENDCECGAISLKRYKEADMLRGIGY